MNKWNKAQEWETDWHGDCLNTYGEEEKQLLYANRMGLTTFHNGKSPYNFNMQGKTIIDIGGGPASLLLKCVNRFNPVVIDPMTMPDWVRQRYAIAGIKHYHYSGEDFLVYLVNLPETRWEPCDEIWMYNVLQHTQDPELIIQNARKAAKLIRIFEWINTSTNVGHIHTLTEENLNTWLGGYGKVETLTGQANCYGRCYYGIFPT